MSRSGLQGPLFQTHDSLCKQSGASLGEVWERLVVAEPVMYLQNDSSVVFLFAADC